MMLMIEAASAVRFPAAASFCSSSSSAAAAATSSTTPNSTSSWNRFRRGSAGSFLRNSNSHLKSRIRVSAEHLDSASDHSPKQIGTSRYHPFEEIGKSISENDEGDAILSAQERARTIVELNSKATLILVGVFDDEIHENIVWPDLPYVTDEHGNIYIQVKNDEDILRTLTSGNNYVIVSLIENLQEEEDGEDSLGDWAKLDTMRNSHPVYFAKKLAEVASDAPVDWMEQPPAGLAIQGLIRPAFTEEHSDIHKHMLENQSSKADIKDVRGNVEDKLEDQGLINGHKNESGPSEDSSFLAKKGKKDKVPTSGTSFYKLEMTKIQLISALGHNALVEIEDFRKARPDTVALSAAKIVSRLKAGGEKITQALKSLCWRCKGIQVEATSLHSAERQVNDLLFPRVHHKAPQKKHTRQNEH
ncbi:hypothetical protein Tsubulata_032135 [Turnera subulata]|uniref:Uncharacterized protein n=1 Tax=Turnera subulata TaxID=218843 RepID=A0A9Q0F4E2_9ROSI|nr:hypothetical protein Tsubulata_032135 [Turnera subulata]